MELAHKFGPVSSPIFDMVVRQLNTVLIIFPIFWKGKWISLVWILDDVCLISVDQHHNVTTSSIVHNLQKWLDCWGSWIRGKQQHVIGHKKPDWHWLTFCALESGGSTNLFIKVQQYYLWQMNWVKRSFNSARAMGSRTFFGHPTGTSCLLAIWWKNASIIFNEWSYGPAMISSEVNMQFELDWLSFIPSTKLGYPFIAKTFA